MSLGDAIYNSNWYEYPRGMAKYPILIIAQSQTPIYFFGYGLFRCTLEVYGRVSSKSFYKQAFICPYLKKKSFFADCKVVLLLLHDFKKYFGTLKLVHFCSENVQKVFLLNISFLYLSNQVFRLSIILKEKLLFIKTKKKQKKTIKKSKKIRL